MKAVSNIQELIRVIGANSSKESMLVEIRTWDDDNNRVVRGSNYEGPRGADVFSIITTRIDGNLLWKHVKSLLKTGKSFIISMSSNRVEWSISDS